MAHFSHTVILNSRRIALWVKLPALPNPCRINPKNPESKSDPKGKTCLATKGKLSYTKMSTIHFQPILFYLKVSAKASTSAAVDFFLSCHPGVWCSRGLTPQHYSLLRSLPKQEAPHPQLSTKNTTSARQWFFKDQPSQGRQVNRMVREKNPEGVAMKLMLWWQLCFLGYYVQDIVNQNQFRTVHSQASYNVLERKQTDNKKCSAKQSFQSYSSKRKRTRVLHQKKELFFFLILSW